MLAQGQSIRKRALLIVCGAALEAWAIAAVAQSPGSDIPRHVAATLAASAAWVLAMLICLRLPSGGWRRDMVLIFVVAVAMRATLLGTTPSLSDDAYRAVWDGRLVHAGVNPYEHAPVDPAMEPYRDDTIWPRVNHKEQRTPYPPLAVLLESGAYALLPERLVAMQALAAIADLAAAALLAWLLARIGSDPRRCLAMAWSPIGALHFAHSAHNDAVMIAGIVAVSLLLTYRRRYTAFVALGLATAIKGVPALTVPAFIRAGGWTAALFWAATCALVALPFIRAGLGLAAGALTEAGGQRFNDSAYLLAERMAELVAPGQGAAAASVLAASVVIGAAITSFVWSDGSPRGALVSGSRVLGVYLLAAPVVEPWYFTWMAPLIALELKRSRGFAAFSDALAWIWLTCAATLTELTYLAANTGLWPVIRLVEYLPAYGLLAMAILVRRAGRQEEEPAPEGAPALRSTV